MRNSQAPQGRATILVLALSLLAGGNLAAQDQTPQDQAAQNEPMTMMSGSNEVPVNVGDPLPLQEVQVTVNGKSVTIPGAYTLPQEAYKILPTARTNRDLTVKRLGSSDGDTIVLFTLRSEGTTETVASFEPCDSFEITANEDDNVRPVNVFCNEKGYLVNGGLVALLNEDGTYNALARIPSRRAPVPGTDVGVALTIMKTNDSGQGYKFFEGATAYYSLTRLKTSSLRLVANLSALDMDPNKDFETGLGFGLLLRTPYTAGAQDRMGFGVLIGGGYNFMLDARRDEEGKEAEPWYWFVGFSWNFNRGNS